ncbi:lipid A 3-O-deacylase [Dyella flava]|nr:lipid A 3-O-deacylase [Dyella flava]
MNTRAVLSCLTVLVLTFGCVAHPAIAADPLISIEGGWSFMGMNYTVDKSTAAAFVEALFGDHPIGSTAFTWAPDVTAGWISGRGYPCGDYQGYSARNDIWLIAAGLRFHYGAANAWYRPFFFSLQPTLHAGLTPAESGNYEFTLTLGWQARHWMLGVRHSSNADLNGPNLGETMLVGGVTF